MNPTNAGFAMQQAAPVTYPGKFDKHKTTYFFKRASSANGFLRCGPSPS